MNLTALPVLGGLSAIAALGLAPTAMLALAAVPAHASSITISVTPWLAPNAYGSSSFPQAEANAVDAMENNVSAYGTPGTPSYFQAQPNVTSAEGLVTSFPSWLGMADPGSVFGPAFANELGNRMTFAVRILGNGTQFSISQLSFSATSTDGNGLGFGYSGGYTYGPGYVGVIYGQNGNPNTYITSGPSTQLVDALFGRGSGNSYWPYDPSFPGGGYCSSGCTVAQEQALINETAAWPGYPYTFTGTYTLTGGYGTVMGSGTFDIAPTPLPAALPLFASGLGIMGLLGWRKKRKHAAPAAA